MSKFPKIKFAFNGWEQNIILSKVVQIVQNFKVISSETPISFKGVVQPFSAQQLNLRPQEERSWQWLMIHAKTLLNLKTNDIIKYNSKSYKVMKVWDYSLNGYYQYDIVEIYE